MRKKQILSLTVLLCLFLSTQYRLQAQTDQTIVQDSVLQSPVQRYLTLGLATFYMKLNDEHLSPLNYEGGSFLLQLGAFKRKKRTIRNLTFSVTTTTLSPKADNREIDPRGNYYRFDLAYSQHFHVRSFQEGKYRWYLGGILRSSTNVRLNPQLDGGFITLLFANGLFASSVIEREVRVSSRPLTLSWQLDLPIINHIIRPSYLNIYDFVNPENNWVEERLEDSSWNAINRYSNITSTVSILYPIKAGNVLKFSYEWDFYRVSTGLRATRASHTFMFSFLFNF
ncbi:MAG: hypothetical protein AAFQ94_19025 [Bacteroidota bacterium]